MNKKQIIVWKCGYILDDDLIQKLILHKNKLPIARKIDGIQTGVTVNLKYKVENRVEYVGDNVRFVVYKDFVCLDIQDKDLKAIRDRISSNEFLFIVIEGSLDKPIVILRFSNREESIFSYLESQDPGLRLAGVGLPPMTYVVIERKKEEHAFYSYFAKKDPDLFSWRTQRFLQTPHILTYLFSQVMSLESKEHINYISVLKVLADHFRKYLEPFIQKVRKNHHELWSHFYGDRITFLDGGMSRIVSLPGTEPMGIRVGIYTVIPGETDLSKREEWFRRSFVIGDVISDRSSIVDNESQTDVKRLQETARYILEPLTGYKYIEECKTPPRVMFLHGPLQNSFETYDESDPFFIPSLNKEFLAEFGIERMEVVKNIQHIPKDFNGYLMWNGCICIYALLMNKIFKAPIPIAGVVERSRSRSFTASVLKMFSDQKIIPKSTINSIWKNLQKYEIGDELLFGCVLDEGEYIKPLEIVKNKRNRAHEKWRLVVDQFPRPSSTMIKCSANNFPFRVEFNKSDDPDAVHNIVSLLYHTALLLPKYSFPVGIDIADKYAKIPDWLSKGISERLTAHIFKKVLETGNDQMLKQIRQLLALSPRDFFFRPKM